MKPNIVCLAGAMRTSEFDSSSEEEDVGEEQLTPFHVSWLPLSVVECAQFLGICALPGCKYKDIRRSLERDVEELQNQGVQEVFVFCTRGELNKYRVPSLLEVYRQRGFTVHHTPFPDGDAPELQQCCQILEELQVGLENNRRTVIHRCLSAAPALSHDDGKQSHRNPEGAPRRRSHTDREAIQLPPRVSGKVRGVPRKPSGVHRALGVPVITPLIRERVLLIVCDM
ncbi:cyclin-dependent kinase inhibitor 3 isoform X3 [Cyclopterus lumpus]|uniref:cyclin-dependent kinase inhibitor 3 isoform X3 n=1 Tax=Cyclopterus lumpus TaxID=8103 RepID=UPI0014865570|nr:cyclin-dependent kinase inhibitor 3 isoform X3 [Cyclopterus lumpus]